MDSSYMHLPNENDDDENSNENENDNDNSADNCDDGKSEDECSDEKTPLLTKTHTHNNHRHEPSRMTASTLKICPTCHGKGKLSQSEADKVVALIPASDKRLRPRRTELYLTLTAVFCIVSGCLLVFFLWPRAVYVHVEHTDSINIQIDDVNNTFIDIKVSPIFSGIHL